jgi:hypothetical protein
MSDAKKSQLSKEDEVMERIENEYMKRHGITREQLEDRRRIYDEDTTIIGYDPDAPF